MEVDETFMTIWLSRSSEVRVKVRRLPQSPIGNIFNIYFWLWQKSCKLLDMRTRYFTYLILRAAVTILAKLQFINNLTRCNLSLYFKNEYTWLVYLSVCGDLLWFACKVNLYLTVVATLWQKIWGIKCTAHYSVPVGYVIWYPAKSSSGWILKMASGTSLILYSSSWLIQDVNSNNSSSHYKNFCRKETSFIILIVIQVSNKISCS